MTGRLTVVGLGPGRADWLLPDAAQALNDATDIVGYHTYLGLIPAEFLSQQRIHGSDNRVELERARLALSLAAQGHAVAVVSSGDPGVFAMAAAVFEAQIDHHSKPAWLDIDVEVIPGVTAALATAARIGAPLGHDWCCLSLSDNLKPWSIIERRLRAALSADFALALYNPVSKARPSQLRVAFDIVASYRDAATPIVFGRNVGRRGETVTVNRLDDVELSGCDMATVILIGSSTTVTFQAGGRTRVLTPRSYPAS